MAKSHQQAQPVSAAAGLPRLSRTFEAKHARAAHFKQTRRVAQSLLALHSLARREHANKIIRFSGRSAVVIRHHAFEQRSERRRLLSEKLCVPIAIL